MDAQIDADFDGWVLHHRERLLKSAFLICGDWHLADDLVQEALIRCYPRWDRIISGGDPYPYLRQSVVRLCIDHSRRPSRRELAVVVPAEEPLYDEPDFEHLLTALRGIPVGQRTALVLRHWEGLSVEETAAVTRTSAGTVKSQTSRGMQALRDVLVPSAESEDA